MPLISNLNIFLNLFLLYFQTFQKLQDLQNGLNFLRFKLNRNKLMFPFFEPPLPQLKTTL